MAHTHQPTSDHDRRGFSLIELLFVLALTGLLIGMALPAMSPAVGGYQLSGDAHGIAYQVAVAKMRAASYFTKARVYADLSSRTYRLEIWNKGTAAWTAEGGTQRLSGRVDFSFGPAATPPPPYSLVPIAQSAPCRNNANTADIANTACIVFNSRGIPIDFSGAPVGGNALYVADATAVYGTIISATGLIHLWWTPTSTLAWQQQ